MMKQVIIFLSIFLILFSCTLSTEQEMQLQKSIGDYIAVRNDGDGLSYMNFTHQKVVSFYNSQGDSVLTSRFQEMPRTKDYYRNDSLTYWDKGYVKSVKKQGDHYQVKIEISLAKGHKKLNKTTTVYGFSQKNASNWLFANEKDYLTIIPKEERWFE